MKSQVLLAIFIAASMNAAADELNLGAFATKQNDSVVIDTKQLASLRDGSDPEMVWKSLNELTYLSRAGSREAFDTLFNTLLNVIDNKEVVVDCDQSHPRYDIKLLLAPLSRNAEIWTYLGKTNKQLCERVQSVYRETSWLYSSKYDNPNEADICEVLFAHR